MDALNPFSSKLMTFPKGRFVNLFGDFSPLCGRGTRYKLLTLYRQDSPKQAK